MSQQTKFSKTNLLGLEIDQIDTTTAVKAIVEFGMQAKQAGYIVRPHVEFIEQAVKSNSIMKLLNNAQFCLADGVALQWAAHHLEVPGKSFWHLLQTLSRIPRNSPKLRGVISERVAGIAFTLQLLETCQRQQATVFLVGSPARRPIEHTTEHLRRHFPGLKISGGFRAQRVQQRVSISSSQEKQLLRILAEQKPDVVLVGLGFPRQEFLMSRLASKLKHGVFIGEGGSFDYTDFGGHIRRAPRSVQRAGLEWLWRLAHQPQRIRRQTAIPRFVRRVHKHKKST